MCQTQAYDAQPTIRDALADSSGEEQLVLRTQFARSLGLQNRFDECSGELDALDAALTSGGPAATPLVGVHSGEGDPDSPTTVHCRPS